MTPLPAGPGSEPPAHDPAPRSPRASAASPQHMTPLHAPRGPRQRAPSTWPRSTLPAGLGSEPRHHDTAPRSPQASAASPQHHDTAPRSPQAPAASPSRRGRFPPAEHGPRAPPRAAQAPPPDTALPRASLPPRREKSALGQSEAFPRAPSARLMANGEPAPEARASRRLTVDS
ncbi:elongin BC and Polycomb repressive complex 2-associated protein-like [Melozone crissalis]|uniref:elongin BC and Polycomb repressive complex 2-associated protein-like n=1 Tax=Melozone crissalis TaxID=40204 RepID=UPI0023DBD68E|nr:elongin BC and Polycomb repressive complex 2-associated protein-like [Melozone crissalis]